MEYRSPTHEEWTKIQGHVPFVEVNGKMLNIIHPKRIIPTPIEYLEQMGTINLKVPDTGEIVCTHVAYLEKLHGIPCEQRSRAIGGKDYNSRI